MATRLGIMLLAFLGYVMLSAVPALAEDPDVPALIGQVGGGDAKARLEAVDSLTDLGLKAAPATPALIAALASDDATLRWHAARALGAIGLPAAPSVPALAKALTDTDPLVRAHAARALGLIGPASLPAAKALADAVLDSDASVRRAAVRALATIKPPPQMMIPLMIKTLEDADPSVIMPAIQALAERGADAVPVLVQALDHPKAVYWAALALGEIGPKAEAAVPALVKALANEQPEVRSRVLLALAAIGPAAKSATADIVKALDDPENSVRYAAVFAVVQIGDTGAIDKLRANISSPDPFLAMISAWGVAKLSPNDEAAKQQAVQLLVKGLGSDQDFMRRGAARGLMELNADPTLVAPALIAALKDGDPQSVAHTREALATLGATVVPRVMRALENPEMRIHAAIVLGRIGPEAAPAVPALIEALKADKSPEFTREAQFALAAIGQASAPAVPLLIESLSSDKPEIRGSAVYALGKIGPAAKDAIPKLKEKLAGDDEWARATATWALLQIEPNNAEIQAAALPVLIKALENEREMIRHEAALSLGLLKSLPPEAIVALQKATQDENESVRAAATETLKKAGQ